MEREPLGTRMLGRSVAAMVAVAAVFLLLLVRILLIQTLQFDRYQNEVISNMTHTSAVAAARGQLTDRNGNLLATNITSYRIFIAPATIADEQKELDKNEASGEENEAKVPYGTDYAELIARGLSEILEVSYETVLAETEKINKLDRTIKRNVDDATADRVRAFIAEHGLEQMIYLEATTVRYYPYGSLAAQLLGFCRSDGVGLYGIEYQYEEDLAGTDGYYIVARDTRGREIPYAYSTYVDAEHGTDLQLTLDAYLQAALEEQVKTAWEDAQAANGACGIVMDVNTGAILAMATYPTFDLNDPWALDPYSEAELTALGLDEKSDAYNKAYYNALAELWSNKAVNQVYIPGSTFKIITSSMALTENLVQRTEVFTCHGVLQVGGRSIHCHKRSGHGTLTFEEGLQQSCNPVFMTMGLRLGQTNFYHYMDSFGFLEKTGIDLPGEGGSIFYDEERFGIVDLVTSAFGQNFKISAIQLLTAISAVANGGKLMTPYVVQSMTDGSGALLYEQEPEVRRQVISEEVSAAIADILEQGVSGGGGAKNAYVPGYKIAAKTGTSQKIGDVEGGYIGSCVAFAPADDPQIAVLLIVDEPTGENYYGSIIAAPYVARFLENVLPYLGVEPEYSEEELENMAMTVSSYVGWSVNTARQYAEKAGLEVTVVGSGSVIGSQVPEGGAVVEKDSARVIFYTRGEQAVASVKVPDVVGLTAAAANQKIVSAGLNIRLVGAKQYLSGQTAMAVSQSVEAGSSVPPGTVVEVYFYYLDDADTD